MNTEDVLESYSRNTLLESALSVGERWDGPMAPQPIVKRTCEKMRYATRKEARAAINRRMSFGNRPTNLYSYFCNRCGGYHLTKSERREATNE